MTPFVYDPKAPAETLDAFNARLKAYCATSTVVEVAVKATGGMLMLFLLDADGLPEVPPVALCPVVHSLPLSERARLEDFLGGTGEDSDAGLGAIAEAEESFADIRCPALDVDAHVIDKTIFVVTTHMVAAIEPGPSEEDPS